MTLGFWPASKMGAHRFGQVKMTTRAVSSHCLTNGGSAVQPTMLKQSLKATSPLFLRVHSLFAPVTMCRMSILDQLVAYCDDKLRISEISDWPNALNGLQIENSGAVTRIGAAVDASTRTIDTAIERGINFLIVHHGLFWPGLQPITGARRRMFERAFRA